MAETLTPRFGLRQWSAPSDTVSRGEFNEAFKNIEDRGAIDSQGNTSSRPPAGVRGRYFYALDTGITWRDTGSTWEVVGSYTTSAHATASNVSSSALTVYGVAGQSADIFRVRNSTGFIVSRFNQHGGFKSGGVYIASNSNESIADRIASAALSVEPISASHRAAVFRGRPGQAANIFEVRGSNDAQYVQVGPSGTTYLLKAEKNNDTDPTSDFEFVTYGALKRNVPNWNVRNLSQSQYNALSYKDPNTLYVIT